MSSKQSLPATAVVTPPEGTSVGCRGRDGSMWIKCAPEPDKKPGIASCDHPGNWVNPPHYKLVAVFEFEADRDFVLELHAAYVTGRSIGVKEDLSLDSPSANTSL